MGKKRKLIAYPQKYAAKFAAHPANRITTGGTDEVITEEIATEEIAIEEATAPALETTTPEIAEAVVAEAEEPKVTTKVRKIAKKTKAKKSPIG
jgi:hypothetical protein|tara:strand:+ start:8604 stop:8885 length:282 start_codon:yes stop_codon:yes gene_type:complete